jgi:hypothetical protein
MYLTTLPFAPDAAGLLSAVSVATQRSGDPAPITTNYRRPFMRLRLLPLVLCAIAPVAAPAATMTMRADQNSDGSLAPHVVPEVGGQAVGTYNPMPVTGSFSATLQGFAPNGNVASITASTTSGRATLPAGTVVEIANTGTVQARIRLGDPTVTAGLTDLPVDPNEKPCFTVGSNTNVAAITASGSTTLVLAAGSGVCGTFGGGSGLASGAVSAAITPQQADAATALVLKSSQGIFYSAAVVNYSTTSGFMIAYNAAAAPSQGALTASLVLACAPLPPSNYAMIHFPTPATLSFGITILLTSAPNCSTYTTGAITGKITGQAS